MDRNATMQALKKALLDLRVAVLAEIVRRNMLTADEAALRAPAPPPRKPNEDVPAERGRRSHSVSLWKRLIGRRLARQRKPPIWPTPQHMMKGDNAPEDGRR